MLKILLISTLMFFNVRGLSFDYLQEYSIGENGNEITSSQVKGIIYLKPFLAGDNIEWIIILKNFSIFFNDSDPDTLHITCSTFVSNPAIQTLLLEDEDPTINTCPDELKHLVSQNLLSLKGNSSSKEKDIEQQIDFQMDQHCKPIRQNLSGINNSCIVRTILQTRNCSSDNHPTENSLGKSSLFKFFKVNFTIEAVFEECDVTVLNLKMLQTDRFYLRKEGDELNYARISERYVQIDEDLEEIEGQAKGTELNFDEDETDQKKQVQWKADAPNDWFEMFSLINSVYAPNIVYQTLSDWVFS